MQNNLKGKPEHDVEPLMGKADSTSITTEKGVWKTTEKGKIPVWRLHERWVTFNYYPLPLLPVGKVQVHCKDGMVDNIELFDD